MPFFWKNPIIILVVLASSCVPAATSLHNSGNFSNIRSEIRLTDGSVIRGYASMNALKGDDALRVRVAGERTERTIPLAKVDRLLAEEHEFVVKMLQTPARVNHGSKVSPLRAMVKRLGMEHDALQVFEYKYPVANPKSPISNTATTWYVSFPGDADNLPLVEMNSPAYRQKWAKLSEKYSDKSLVQAKEPSSVKNLLEAVKKIPAEADSHENFGAAE